MQVNGFQKADQVCDDNKFILRRLPAMKQITLTIMITIGATLTFFGCGGSATMTQTVAPRPTPNVKFIPAENTVYISGIKKVAIFPFADYSHQQGSIRPDIWGGNIRIQEEIADHLVAHGLTLAVQEDVNTLLVDHDIIRAIDAEKYLIHPSVAPEVNRDGDPVERVESLEYALANHVHTQVMADEIMTLIETESRRNQGSEVKIPNSPVLQGATVGLTKDKVVYLAQQLGVDLVVRGRILDYGIKETASASLYNSGLVPVVFRGTRDLLLGGRGSYDDGAPKVSRGIVPSVFGDARSFMMGGTDYKNYEADLDDIDNLAYGATLGALIGSGSGPALLGGAAGYIVGQQPQRSKRSAIVQVRIYAQSGETGDVLWSNRVEIEFTPANNFDNKNTHPRVMYENAVREGIKSLMDGFFVEAEGVFSEAEQQIVPVQKEGT
jgi:hypothetical protein